MAKNKEPLSDDKIATDAAIRILGIIILLLCVVGLFRINAGAEPPTFTDFMFNLTEVPTIAIPNFGNSLYSLLYNANWGAFDFFRILFANLASVLDFAIYIVNLCIQLTTVLIYFVRWVFVF